MPRSLCVFSTHEHIRLRFIGRSGVDGLCPAAVQPLLIPELANPQVWWAKQLLYGFYSEVFKNPVDVEPVAKPLYIASTNRLHTARHCPFVGRNQHV